MSAENKVRLVDVWVGVRDPRQVAKVEHNLAVLRQFVLNLLRLSPVRRKGRLKTQRLIAATSDSFRAELLGLV